MPTDFLASVHNVATKELEQVLEMVDTDTPVNLIVWNDEVNTFDWVIQSLIEVCGHTVEQAEQSAWIIHYKGKYAVKRGTRKKACPHARGTSRPRNWSYGRRTRLIGA